MPNIRAISCVVPRYRVENQKFYEHFKQSHIKSVQNIVGVKNRFWSQEETSLSLCCEASENLFDDLTLKDRINPIYYYSVSSYIKNKPKEMLLDPKLIPSFC